MSKLTLPADYLKNPAVFCQDLHFTYPDQQPALRGISLKIDHGEKVAIIGPNGAGKSTFLSLLNGLLKGEGLLRIYGLEVIKKHDKLIKSLVGLVFQNPDDQLFCPTIFEDVAFGPLNLGLDRALLQERVHQALQEVGLSGYENRSSINISFGEKKLVSIATILSMQPQIVAMDEPTGYLDHAHRRRIINWIQSNNRTVLVTTHDLDLVAETCRRVILFNAGKMVADGPVTEILNDEPLLNQNNLEKPASNVSVQSHYPSKSDLKP